MHYYRRNLRLPDHDYSSYGPYFVTLITYKGQNLFGKIENDEFIYHIPELADLFFNTYNIIEDNMPGVKFFERVTMPDHVHFIVANNTNHQKILGDIVKEYKSIIYTGTVKLIKDGRLPEYKSKFWQRDYYEKVIMNPQSYRNYANYIRNNPKNYKKQF